MDKFVIKKTGWTFWVYKIAWCVGFRYSRGDDFCKLVRRFLLAFTLLTVLAGVALTLLYVAGLAYHKHLWKFPEDASWYLYVVSFLSLPVIIVGVLGGAYAIVRGWMWLYYTKLSPLYARACAWRNKRWEAGYDERIQRLNERRQRPTPQWRVALRAWAQKYCIKIDME